MTIITRARTVLFVPGNRPDRIDKAAPTAADIVAIDLEDSVPAAEKHLARDRAREKIRQHAPRPMLVRVNALDSGLAAADLGASVVPGLSGVILPKTQRPVDVDNAHALLLEYERSVFITAGATGLILLLESALAVENAFLIASAAQSTLRTIRLAFGAADFAADMGILLSRTGEELEYPRSRIAVASRAAGIAPPLDSPFMTDLKDLDALKADTLRAKQVGFGGRLCIHPSQISVCNSIFSPSPDAVAFARKALAAFESSEAKGRGAIQVDGRMVDAPIAAQYRRILSVARERGL